MINVLRWLARGSRLLCAAVDEKTGGRRRIPPARAAGVAPDQPLTKV
jgi:hypothetical protein